MSEQHEELEAPEVSDVPEPDQEPNEPTTEDDAPEPEQRPEDAPSEAQAQGVTPEQWEKRFKSAEKAFDAYHRKINTIFEDDAHDLLPVVISPSAPPGFLHKADAGRVPEDIQTPIMEFFGVVRERDYKPDPLTETCEACDGEGKTQTGSKVPTQRTRPCPTCGGRGYTTKDGTPLPANAGTNGQTVHADFNVGPLVEDDRDNWGEPKVLPDGRLNPNYGKQPQFKEMIEPWGVTAGLGAVEGVS